MIKKILVFGAGYVGYSLGILLAERYEVVIVDTDESKVSKINNRQPPINDSLIESFLDKQLDIKATNDPSEYIGSADLIILALPTNYDELSNFFDTSILESVFDQLNKLKISSSIVIKSTIPLGFTEKVRKEYKNLNIFFVPEFLREGNAIEDTLYPSRIIIGDDASKTYDIVDIFSSIAKKKPKILHMSPSEAEATKLFANSYLAARISFFNELDSYALEHKLNSKNIIDGISSDSRIGNGYNNPSFGYGGYCLPKDTKQLLTNFKGVPQAIFSAVVESNDLRKRFIAKEILSKNINKIGIFRLIMKKGSDNFRESAIFDVIQILIGEGKDLLIYEPLLNNNFESMEVTDDLAYFKNRCNLIIANRMDDKLIDIKEKVYTRDIYGNN